MGHTSLGLNAPRRVESLVPTSRRDAASGRLAVPSTPVGSQPGYLTFLGFLSLSVSEHNGVDLAWLLEFEIRFTELLAPGK